MVLLHAEVATTTVYCYFYSRRCLYSQSHRSYFPFRAASHWSSPFNSLLLANRKAQKHPKSSTRDANFLSNNASPTTCLRFSVPSPQLFLHYRQYYVIGSQGDVADVRDGTVSSANRKAFCYVGNVYVENHRSDGG